MNDEEGELQKPVIDPAKVRFCYLRDPRDSNRVLTIARILDGDKVHYECAVNNIEYESSYEDSHKRINRKQSDVFSRRLGRKIALGRLLANPKTIHVQENERAIEAVVESIASPVEYATKSNRESICRRIAKSHLSSFKKVTAEKSKK